MNKAIDLSEKTSFGGRKIRIFPAVKGGTKQPKVRVPPHPKLIFFQHY